MHGQQNIKKKVNR